MQDALACLCNRQLEPALAVLPMKTTSTAAKAAVAEYTSIFLAFVNTVILTEKIAVKMMSRPSLHNILCTKYNTSIITVGKRDEMSAARASATRVIFLSS